MRAVFSTAVIFTLYAVSLAGQAGEKADKDEVPGVELGRMGESATVDPDEFQFSEAESKLWMQNHLGNIDKPGRLYYKFQKSGSFEEGFDDSVYLDILKVNDDGSKDTNLEFFTGNRQQDAGPQNLTRVRGNPVLGVYMQGDVREMNRLTDGSWRYFQRRIKMAFSRNAKVEPVTITYHGNQVDAEKITIQPYLNDPHRRQFEQFADKVYEFILSSEIPGQVYQIKTVVPNGEKPDGDPLIVEKLTFQEADFKG